MTDRASRRQRAKLKNDTMGLAGAVSIAVGTMIGASIFSVFGLGCALNATLYPGATIGYALARDGELPQLLD